METIKGYWGAKRKKIARAESRFKAIGSALNSIPDYPLRDFYSESLSERSQAIQAVDKISKHLVDSRGIGINCGDH